MSKGKLYTIILLLSIAGYFWIIYNIYHFGSQSLTVCPFRIVTGMPCPSCGTTEAMVLAAKGHIIQALTVNPLVLVASFIITVFPLWVIFDLIFKKNSFLTFYFRVEKILKIRIVAAMAILLVLTVWAWNIYRILYK